jgi:hypothetical protein
MLRDNLPIYYPPQPDDLSVTTNHEVTFIIAFIDRNISKFRTYYLSIKDSERENRISDFLVHYFQLCLREEGAEGFSPFDFRKNPTQQFSGKETDIGVFVLTRSSKPVTIIEFEAKRFYESPSNKEYVCGLRGGIERFKRGEHARHLPICGMFGYVQSRTSTEWIKKVNGWIAELAEFKLTDIDWSGDEEKPSPVVSFADVEKLKSINRRIQPQKYKTITLYHYFINLLPS